MKRFIWIALCSLAAITQIPGAHQPGLPPVKPSLTTQPPPKSVINYDNLPSGPWELATSNKDYIVEKNSGGNVRVTGYLKEATHTLGWDDKVGVNLEFEGGSIFAWYPRGKVWWVPTEQMVSIRMDRGGQLTGTWVYDVGLFMERSPSQGPRQVYIDP